MRPMSEAQFRAATGGGVPAPERIAGGAGGGPGEADETGGELWSVAIPMPDSQLAYTLSVVHLGQTGVVTIVDPGWRSDEGLGVLAEFLASHGRGIRDVETVVVTHAHADHLGAAELLRREGGARLLMHEREQAGVDRGERTAARPDRGPDIAAQAAGWGAPADAAERLAALRETTPEDFEPPTAADAALADGERIRAPGLDWEVLWTPGHTPGHICLADRARGLLLTGDHVLPTVFPGIGLGVGVAAGVEAGSAPGEGRGGPIADYLASLDRLAPYDDFEAVPGHGYRFRGLGERRAETAAHVRRRADEVAAVVAEAPAATVWEVASRLSWTAGWERLSAGPLLYSALLQTGLYIDFVRVPR